MMEGVGPKFGRPLYETDESARHARLTGAAEPRGLNLQKCFEQVTSLSGFVTLV